MNELLSKVKRSPNINQAFEERIKSHHSAHTEVITFVNPHSYMLLRDQEPLVKQIDAIYSDAISSAKFFSFLMKKSIPRVSFDQSSFAKDFLERANQEGFPLYIIGAQESELKKTIANFKNHYKHINIVGYHDGYFKDDDAMIDDIISTNPEFVICGMGTPRQDEFAVKLKLRAQGSIKQIYTCGGFLHQSAQSLIYYPAWIDKLQLRWLYRIFENSYVIKRLLKSYPKFFMVATKDTKQG